MVYTCNVLCLVAQSCLTLCNSMDCSPPLSLRILQTKIMKWVAMTSYRGSSHPRDWTSPHCRKILYHLRHQGSPTYNEIVLNLKNGNHTMWKTWMNMEDIFLGELNQVQRKSTAWFHLYGVSNIIRHRNKN